MRRTNLILLEVGLFVHLVLFATFSQTISLSREEMSFVEAHGIITIGVDPEFSPYEFIDSDGVYKGISADYLRLIEKKSGLLFEEVKDMPWMESYEQAVKGSIDLLPCLGVTDQRKEYFLFTEGYLTYQRVLLSHKENRPHSFSKLNEYRVGVQKNTSHYSFLLSESNVTPILYNTLDDLLIALSRNEIDVAVTNYASSRYRIKELALANIKIDDIYKAGETQLAMAVGINNTILHSILSKSLSQITKEERTLIHNKWLGIEERSNYNFLIRNFFIGMGIVLSVMVLVLFWLYTLKKEISQRKGVEKELIIAKCEADRANNAKSLFLAHMSHEIRTPMNAISGITYLLENTTTSAIQKKYLKSLKASSKGLLKIINDVLDFSKIEAGEVTLEEVSFDLDKLLEELGNIFMSRANEKNLTLHIRKGRDVVTQLVGDPTRVEQILINLLNNAIKFTQNGGVRLVVEQTLQANSEDRVIIHFSVIDTGIGIPEDQIPLLFTPFHQLDSSITRKFGGTGLGLSISRDLAMQMKGVLNAESHLGEGTNFTLTLPFQYSPNKEKERTQNFPNLENITALIIESDELDRSIVGDYLESFQIKTLRVGTLKEAEKVYDESINLILTELSVDGQNSLPLISQLSTIKGLNIIIMARYISESQHERAEALGVNCILMKPIISSLLLDCIVQIFSQTLLSQIHPPQEELFSGSHQILLVEDNEVNQMIGKAMLEQKGYKVSIAENGKEAVEKAKNHGDIDVILMDIHMPVMDGYEATKRIRQFNQVVPIIAMTAVSYENLQEQCSLAGMSGFVTKPIDPDRLFTVLRVQLSGKKNSNHQEDNSHHMEDVSYIDTKQGLERIGNDRALYWEILDKFYYEALTIQEEVNREFKNNNLESIKKSLHKLKGTAGNVGCIRLFQTTKTFMDVIDSNFEQELGPYIQEFNSDFTATRVVIEDLMRKNRPEKSIDKEKAVLSAIERDDLIKRLINLLGESDLDGVKVFNKLKEDGLPAGLDWDLVESHMNKYQFEKAREILLNYPFIQTDKEK